MRIAHVTNALCADGTGITNVVVDLAWRQAQDGHDVRVLCRRTDAPTIALLAASGVRVGALPATGIAALGGVPALRRALREADIVHVHTVKAAAVSALARPLLFRRRSVSTLHNPYQRSVPVMYLARTVVSISRFDAAAVRRRSLGRVRPEVVLNGLIGTPRLIPADAVRADPLPLPSIVYCGALYARKGVDVLLRAMPLVLARVPQAHLVLVGNRDNPDLEQLAVQLGLGGAVTFAGFRADPRAAMKAATVFVLPSRAEGFGNVLTEARSVGAPVIATRVGGIPEALDDGRAGELVPPDDAQALAGAILRVLSDAALRERLVERAAAGLERFTVEAASRSYVALYERLIGSSRRRPRASSARR